LGAVVRRLYTVSELEQRGLTRSARRTAVRTGRLRKVEATVYAAGSDPVSDLDHARAALLATEGVACGSFAGWLLGLEGVRFDGPRITVPPASNGRRRGVLRRIISPKSVIRIDGMRCTAPLQTLVDLAASLEDSRWEQALECALRRGVVTLAEVAPAAAGRQRGAVRMRRVLNARPAGAPPTESLLETLMVQLVRTVPGVPSPERQLRVVNAYGEAVARVDLAWPDIGLFIELDGQHHQGQPVYDARRETAVVAVTGWLCGRFTWHEVVDIPVVTARRVGNLVEQARRRPLSASSLG
jgi:hypothetical protein